MARASISPIAESRPRFYAMSKLTTCKRRLPSVAKRSSRFCNPSSKIICHCDKQTLDLIASFQRAVVEDLAAKTLDAARTYNVATLFVTGGVAANQELRQQFEKDAAREGISVYFPSRPLSTDNAAMIAAAAYPKFLAHDFAPMDFSAEAGMVLK